MVKYSVLEKEKTSVYLVILGLVSGPYTKVNRISTFDSEYSGDVSSVGLVKNLNSWLIWPKPLRLMIIMNQTIWSLIHDAHLIWSLMCCFYQHIYKRFNHIIWFNLKICLEKSGLKWWLNNDISVVFRTPNLTENCESQANPLSWIASW